MGELKNLRWPLVAASLVMTVGILWVVSWGLRASTQDNPLNTFLRSQPAVTAFQVERESTGLRVARLELKPVEDLGQTYRDLQQGISRIVGLDQVKLVVVDRRTPQLNEAFYRINPLIQEALATGRFATLVEDVEGRAQALGVERARVHIDQQHVYLQLHQGADYLYAVLPRPVQPAVPAEVGARQKGWGF